MDLIPEELLKILLAAAAGGLIGLERELRDKAAGFRTLIFISVGAAIFTILSSKLAINSDPNRIAAQIVSGVGFLGAGVILRDRGRVIGLTTAATIWLAAALGMGIGGGQYFLSGSATLLIMVILWIFPHFEHRVSLLRDERTYEIVFPINLEKIIELQTTFKKLGICIHYSNIAKNGTKMVCQWATSGRRQDHDQLIQQLFLDEEIDEFRY